MSLQATPSPFLPSTSISISADVLLQAPEQTFCDPSPPEYCVVTGRHTSVYVTAPNGFSAYAENWDDSVALQTSDPIPGQTMQGTTYTASGVVVISRCRYDIFLQDCGESLEDYVESKVMYATVQPAAFPSGDSIAPSSGSGLNQTFTLTYSSSAGAGDIADMRAKFYGPGGGAGPYECYVRYLPAGNTVWLLNDPGTAWTSGTAGTGPDLQNSQCRVQTASVSAVPSGNQWTITLPLTFNTAWTGERTSHLWVQAQSGATSGWQHRGYWTVPCTAEVTPNPANLSASAGVISFTIDTPSACGWTAPPSSGFLTRIGPGSGTGPGQAYYDYSANTGSQPRSTNPVIAGQTVSVTQAGTPPAGETISYFHLDAIGSVRAVTDGSGNLVSRHDYLPFGQEWSPPGVVLILITRRHERPSAVARA